MGLETIALVSLAATAIGAGVSAYGSIQQANAQQEAAEYNAAVARNNAQASRDSVKFDISRARERQRRLRGSNIAKLSSGGFDLQSSSDVLLDIELQQELDIMSMAYRGSIQANASESQATLFDREAGQARTAGLINATGSILSGVGKGVGNYSSLIN